MVRKSDSEYGLSLLTGGRLYDVITPRRWRVARSVAPFIGLPLSMWTLSLPGTIPSRRYAPANSVEAFSGRLGVVDFPGDGFSAPHVDGQVKTVEHPALWRLQVRDVPAPRLVRSRGHDLLRLVAGRRRAGLLAALEMIVLAQDAVDRRLRRHVLTTAREPWHDLLRRQIAKLRRIDGI
jgi:hypothetical protein